MQTNLAYVLWTVSFFVFLLVPTIMVNLLLHSTQQSDILQGVNRNQLAIFLLVRPSFFVFSFLRPFLFFDAVQT